VVETNHLIVHENDIRNVGTVQHNRTIVEKEVVLTRRNVDHKYVNKVVDLVEHKYNTKRVHVVVEKEVPGQVRYLGDGDRDRPVRRSGMANHHSDRVASHRADRPTPRYGIAGHRADRWAPRYARSPYYYY
jgi:hypothetical protein